MSKPDTVADITPEHNPLSLARDMIKLAEDPECVAGFYMVSFDDGSMRSDGCCYKKKDLLWAIEKLKMRVLGKYVND